MKVFAICLHARDAVSPLPLLAVARFVEECFVQARALRCPPSISSGAHSSEFRAGQDSSKPASDRGETLYTGVQILWPSRLVVNRPASEITVAVQIGDDHYWLVSPGSNQSLPRRLINSRRTSHGFATNPLPERTKLGIHSRR